MWYKYCSSQSNIACIHYSIVTLTCNHSFTQNKQAIYDKCFIVHWYYFGNISYSFKLLYCLIWLHLFHLDIGLFLNRTVVFNI